ncbi:hypothetical protein CVS40_5817 [Lucilia cuprina]|nr:hypothetical protein CVS40_5817 [Lucilia cuprina]
MTLVAAVTATVTPSKLLLFNNNNNNNNSYSYYCLLLRNWQEIKLIYGKCNLIETILRLQDGNFYLVIQKKRGTSLTCLVDYIQLQQDEDDAAAEN